MPVGLRTTKDSIPDLAGLSGLFLEQNLLLKMHLFLAWWDLLIEHAGNDGLDFLQILYPTPLGSEKTACENIFPFRRSSVGQSPHSTGFGVARARTDRRALTDRQTDGRTDGRQTTD